MANYICAGARGADNSQVIVVLNVSDPTNISIAGTGGASYGPTNNLDISGVLGYSGNLEFFETLDLSNPANPTSPGLVNLYPNTDHYWPDILDVIYHQNNNVFAVASVYHAPPYLAIVRLVWRVDVSDPSNPVKTAEAYEIAVSYEGILAGPFSYYARTWITNDILYVLSDALSVIGSPGNYVQVMDYIFSKYSTLDCSNTGGIVIQRANSFSGPVWLVGSGNYLFASLKSENRLWTIDVSVVPNNPVSYLSITDPYGMDLRGNYLYVTSPLDNRVYAIDISTPTAPSIVSSLTHSTLLQNASNIKIDPHRDVAYVTCPAANRVTAIDISNPLTLSILGSIQDNVNLDDVLIVDTNLTQVTNPTLDIYLQISGRTKTWTLDTIIDTKLSTFTMDVGNIRVGTEITHTVGTGETRDYTSLTAWEAAQQRDLVAVEEIEIAECYNDGIMTDRFTIAGWTTSSALYIKIYTPTGQRHLGRLSTGFQLRNTAAGHTITVSNPNVIIEGLEFYITTNYQQINVNIASGTGFAKISHNVIVNASNAAYGIRVEVAPATVSMYIWNNIIYAQWNSAAGIGIQVVDADVPCYIYSNSIGWLSDGLKVGSTNVVRAIGNACLGCTRDYNQKSYFANGSDYNASSLDVASIYGAPGANSQWSVSLGSFLSIAYLWENLHLRNSSNPLYGTGFDLSTDQYLPFTDDIDGETRTRWDIGANLFIYVAPTTVTHTVGTGGTRDYTSLSAWEAAQQRSLCNAKEIEVAECYNDGVMNNFFTLAGWATSEDYYIKIYTPISQRHQGYPDSGFILSYSAGSYTIGIGHANVHLEGLEIKSYVNTGCIQLYPLTDAREYGWIKITKNIFRGNGIGIAGLSYGVPSLNVYIWNNVFSERASKYGLTIGTDHVYYLYSNSIYGFYGISIAATSTVKAKNNASLYLSATGFDFNQKSYFDASSSNNASTRDVASIYGAPGANSVYDALSTDNYMSATVLKMKNTLAAIYQAGVNLSADPDFPFGDDIIGATRDATWDIGAFKYATVTEVIHTVGISGTRDYTSLTAWEAAQQRDLNAYNEIEVAECYNDGTLTDNLVILGWTTSEERYIKIYTPQSQRHLGTKGSGFKISGTGTTYTITVNVPNVWIQGLEVTHTSASYTLMFSSIASGTGWIKVSHNLVYNGSYGIYHINAAGVITFYAWNNFVIVCSRGILITDSTDYCYIYSNSVYGCTQRGIEAPASNQRVTAKNNVVLGTTGDIDFYLTTYFSADSNYNVSTADAASTSKAPGANSIYSALAANNYKSIVSGSEDLHIKNVAADIFDVGTDLSADAFLAFTDDIDAETRAA